MPDPAPQSKAGPSHARSHATPDGIPGIPKPAQRASEVAPKLAPRASEGGPVPPKLARQTSEGGCDRCGAEMFRMHAVWRCPRCGFKTDCCGW